MATYSVRFYPDQNKKQIMTTSVYSPTEKEAKQKFKMSKPQAIIITIQKVGN